MIIINIINLFKISYYSFELIKNKVIEFFLDLINLFVYKNIYIFRSRNKFLNIYCDKELHLLIYKLLLFVYIKIIYNLFVGQELLIIYFLCDLIIFYFDYLLNDNSKIEFRFKVIII